MERTIRAKFKVTRTGQVQYGTDKIMHDVEMSAVYSDDPDSENKKFWDATPNASFKMLSIITDFFEIGHEYYIDITDAAAAEEA